MHSDNTCDEPITNKVTGMRCMMSVSTLMRLMKE
jgi:hypothetical protein